MNQVGRGRVGMRMKMHHGEFEWPAWATWALLGIMVTALITVVATINDIW